MTKKKLLGIILCAMLVLLCAVPAMAADNEPSELDTTVGLDLTKKVEGEIVYTTDEGGTITVAKDDDKGVVVTLDNADVYMSVDDVPCINYDSTVNGDKLTIVVKGDCALNGATGIMTDDAFNGTIELTGDGYLFMRGRNDDVADITAKNATVNISGGQYYLEAAHGIIADKVNISDSMVVFDVYYDAIASKDNDGFKAIGEIKVANSDVYIYSYIAPSIESDNLILTNNASVTSNNMVNLRGLVVNGAQLNALVCFSDTAGVTNVYGNAVLDGTLTVEDEGSLVLNYGAALTVRNNATLVINDLKALDNKDGAIINNDGKIVVPHGTDLKGLPLNGGCGTVTVLGDKDDPTSTNQIYAMDGTALRLVSISLTESNGDLAKDGYCYDSNTKVLTLENVLVSAIDQLPSGDITIKIKGTVVFECAINSSENTNSILITDDNDKNASLIMQKTRNITVLSVQEIENDAQGEIDTYNSNLTIENITAQLGLIRGGGNQKLIIKDADITAAEIDWAASGGVEVINSNITVNKAERYGRIFAHRISMDDKSVITFKDATLGSYSREGLKGITDYLPNGYSVGKPEASAADDYVLDENGEQADNFVLKARSSSSALKTYTITLEKTGNGTLASDRSSESQGATVVITAKGSLNKISAKDLTGAAVTLTDLGAGRYSFNMPAANVTVSAAFSGTDSTIGGGTTGGNTEKDTLVMKMIIGSTVYTVNDKAYNGDAAPVIIDDRTLVPIRVITETCGG
ncbi:MAG: hypothetical protein DBX41_03045, partial [Clostridiales bacterium]